MLFSVGTIALAFLSLVAGRELSIVKKDSKEVIIKSKGNGDNIWLTLSISNGVPTFEIKGNEKGDDISKAKARVQLAINDVHEAGSGARYSLEGTQAYWSDIAVEEIGGKDLKNIILRGRMIHADQDISGNFFTVLLEAVVNESATEFDIRPMIQNFPYSYKDGKGKLELQQLLSSNFKADMTQGSDGELRLGSYASLQTIQDSAIEDGNIESISAFKVQQDKRARSGKTAKSESLINSSEIEFKSTRPKNVTFVEKFSFDPKALSLPIMDSDSLSSNPKGTEDDGKIKAMTIKGSNSGNSLNLGSYAIGFGVAIAALISLL